MIKKTFRTIEPKILYFGTPVVKRELGKRFLQRFKIDAERPLPYDLDLLKL